MKSFRLIEDCSTQFNKEKQPVEWEADRLDYIELVKQMVRVPLNRQTGATVDEMRQGIRILDALEGKKLNDVLELEDADWEHLKQKVQVFPWGSVDRRFLRFITTIQNATQDVID